MKAGKVYIEYQFREGPYGGANQFLKCLRDYLVREGHYSETPEEADFILINHTNIRPALMELKKKHPEKVFIHRMDGPVAKHRRHSKILDLQSFFLDKILCDGTVFQSRWTMESCKEEGYKETGKAAVIHNAPDPAIFSRSKREKRVKSTEKCRLVSTSWSDNWNKGFDVLQYLDEHLDFNRYDLTFIGNSPVEFKNIFRIPPLNSRDLAEELVKYDVFVAASKSESCSNSLIEALNCGLAAAARESGCYREVIKDGGVLAKDAEELLKKLDYLREHLQEYQARIPFYDIEEIGRDYYTFMEEVGEAVESGKQTGKRLSGRNILEWNIFVLYIRIRDKLNRMLRSVKGR